MAVTIDWGTKIISILKTDLTVIQLLPNEIYEMDLDWFRLQLKDLEDGEDGMPYPKTHNHNTQVSLGGLTYARVVEILDPYTITFEDDQYAVNLTGANSNVADKVNVNQVSVRSNNAAGLISTPLIEYASFNGGVTIDTVNGTDGVIFPIGTPLSPCKTIENALTISSVRGFTTLYVIGDLEVSGTELPSFSGATIVGQGPKNTTVSGDGTILTHTIFKNCKVTGASGNGSQIQYYNCELYNISNVSLDAYDCVLSGTIELNDSIPSNFFNCTDGVPGSGTPIIQVNDCESLGIWSYSGGIKLTNMTTAGTNVSFNAPSGRLIVDATDTQGSIIARGVGSISGTTGGTTITKTDLLSNPSIATEIGDIEVSGMTTEEHNQLMKLKNSSLLVDGEIIV